MSKRNEPAKIIEEAGRRLFEILSPDSRSRTWVGSAVLRRLLVSGTAVMTGLNLLAALLETMTTGRIPDWMLPATAGRFANQISNCVIMMTLPFYLSN